MAENKTKTKVTQASVDGYIAAIDDESRRKDCEALAKLMAKAPVSSDPFGGLPRRDVW